MQIQKLNIIIFNFTASSIGGSQYTTLSIAQALRKRGHKVAYVSEGGELVNQMEQEGIKNYILPIRRFFSQLSQFSIPNIIKLVNILRTEKADCIHCFQYFPFLMSCIAQVFTGIPCVYSVIGPGNIRPIPEFKGQIIAVCEEFRDDIVHRNSTIDSNDVFIIRHRIDLEKYKPGIVNSELLNRFEVEDKSKKIVMVTRFDDLKTKAILDLLVAMPRIIEQIPNAVALVVGDGKYFDDFRQRVSRLNQTLRREAVILTGRLSNIPQILNLADVVLGIGRSVLEGMACRKPAIVIGKRGFAGIVSPETVEEIKYFNFAGRNISTCVNTSMLADAIVKILKDPYYAQSLADFAYDFVKKEFDVNIGAEYIEQIYYSLHKGNKKSTLYLKFVPGLARTLADVPLRKIRGQKSDIFAT